MDDINNSLLDDYNKDDMVLYPAIYEDDASAYTDGNNSTKISYKSEDDDYNRMRELANMLWVPTPTAYLTIRVDNPGEEPYSHRQLSKSWTRNMYDFMVTQIGMCYPSGTRHGISFLQGKDTGAALDATTKTPTMYGNVSGSVGIYAAPGSTTNGIVVGTSTAAEDMDSWVLSGLIVNGNGVGQLAYTACVCDSVIYNHGTDIFTSSWRRIMNNNSGNSITVNEVGVYYAVFDSFSTPTYTYEYLLMNRDVLALGVTVLDAGQLTVTYELSLQFP